MAESYLRPFKNPHIIVEACHELAKRGVPFRLIVAGGGEQLEASLKLQSEKLVWLIAYTCSEIPANGPLCTTRPYSRSMMALTPLSRRPVRDSWRVR